MFQIWNALQNHLGKSQFSHLNMPTCWRRAFFLDHCQLGERGKCHQKSIRSLTVSSGILQNALLNALLQNGSFIFIPNLSSHVEYGGKWTPLHRFFSQGVKHVKLLPLLEVDVKELVQFRRISVETNKQTSWSRMVQVGFFTIPHFVTVFWDLIPFFLCECVLRSHLRASPQFISVCIKPISVVVEHHSTYQ